MTKCYDFSVNNDTRDEEDARFLVYVNWFFTRLLNNESELTSNPSLKVQNTVK